MEYSIFLAILIVVFVKGYQTQSTNTNDDAKCSVEEIKALRLEMAIMQEKLDIIVNKIDQGESERRQESANINEQLSTLLSHNVGDYNPLGWQRSYEIRLLVSDVGSYQYTFHQGKSRCEELGGTLPTLAQLQTVFEAGLDKCACGWLADGHSYFPIQFPRDGCGGKDSPTRVVACGYEAKRDVWCLFRK